MTDDTTRRHRIDRRRISLSQDHEVRYWAHKFACTEEQLREAVRKAGSSEAEKVRQQLTHA
jgi:hypothetical protein